jgi:hypothetical protein
MNAQLEAIVDEYRRADDRVERLARAVPDERWRVRPSPESWSAAECIAHLNLTADRYLPLLRDALDEARRAGGGAPARHRMDFLGWLLWKLIGEGGRMRVKTSAPFVPTADADPATLRAAFVSRNAELARITREADGLPLGRVKVRSPFAERVSYNLYSSLRIVPRHEHRHLGQAERAANAVVTAAASASR